MRERKTNAIAKIATTVVWSNRRASLAALGCCLAMITASNVRRDLTRIQTTSITTSSSGIHDIATDSQAPPEWNFDPRLICIHDVSEDGDGDDDDTSATTAATRSTRQQNPAGIVIGSQKSGTDALMKYLWQHPHIPPPKYGWRRELHFFDYYYDDDYDSNSSSSSSSSSSREVLNQTETKLAYQAEVNRNQRRPLNASSEYYIESTPAYMTFSHIMAPRVFCAFPNVKLMAVLRNPVDRMYSHYRMTRSFPKHRIRQKGLSFEQWVQEDMDLMKQAGLYTVDGGKTTTTTTMTTKEYLNSFAGTVEEMKAWERYTNLVQEALLEEKRAKNKTLDFNGIPMPVGRSLYAIHLQIWNLAKKEFGNGGGETEEDNIRQNILAINQEDLKSKRDLEMKKVVRYLNIPNEEFVLDDLPPTDHNSQSYKPMKKETRQWLEEFFEPYNRRLGQLLGPEWDGVWKPKGGVTSEGFA